MKLFNKVIIVGTGLIGGSLAMAMKKYNIAGEIVGMGRHKKNLLLAKNIGAIDSFSEDLSVVKDADLVVLATPVHMIMNLGRKVSTRIKKGCIVTDVGSTKKEIVGLLERIIPDYVGSHPLAGSEKRSIAYAEPGIFKDSLCIITPTKKTSRQALKKIGKLWKRVGANVVLTQPPLHDKILAFTSHLPHALAFALIDSVPQDYIKFASGGLKDTTRIAGSDSELWTDIFLSNSQNLTNSLDKFQEKLSALKLAIGKKDRRRLFSILKKAKGKRDGFK
ncbi:MAG: prephenate dehydrogenase/arogenate dehydrogenase family protein [Candidatus Omnitrophota bacterium]